MKRILRGTLLCLCTGVLSFAQQADSRAPATKEEVQKYLEVMHSREMITKMMEAMSKPIHQMVHEQYLKDKDKLPPDFEERTSKVMDDYLKNLPVDEMLEAMVPIYQKHFTKGDIDALVAFYSLPTGQKLIEQLPAITAEAMHTVMPLIRQRVDVMTQRMREEVAQMMKDSKNKPSEKSQASPN